ncbi:MAG: DUF4405 domain-containing protein [Oscillospiraceae bacterium]|nr:DUF4405 domain-containing protein [Oscillospiraceae bacterium]
MKKKQIVRLSVDTAMTVILLLLMGYSRVGEEAHEWLGIGMTVLFVLHHSLNRKWIAALFRGRYTAFRTVQTILVCGIFIGICISACTGVMLSRHVFRFFGFETGMAEARELHLRCGNWNFLLLSGHLGLHWAMIVGMVGKQIKHKSAILKWLARLLAMGIAVYGVFALLSRNVPAYLFGTIGFSFIDESEPLARFLLDYLAIMGTFTVLGHYTAKLLRSSRREKNITS